ncbi:hypothetical protein ACFWMS_26335 [Peribacillus butanolivorans]|uniref:hypothetical protein n=1 Tax=Peribacillus butanolivorans TaxID=421767 RepID=UPI00364D6085
MAGEYRLRATLWRDREGVRHRRGDVVTPPEEDIDRLLRARAIEPLLGEQAQAKDKSEAVGSQAEKPKTEPVTPQNPEQSPASAQALERPKNAAAKPVWEAYALERGVENAAELSKDQIIDAVNALDAK